MNNKVLVSVIIPCYNQAPYIIECLSSVADQNYKYLECIIIDDGSTDNSNNLIKKFIKTDSRFTLKTQRNSGVASARNLAISIAQGKYILPLDGDDRIGKQYIKLAIAYFEKFPKTDLVYCNAKYFGKKNKKIKLPKYNYDTFLLKNCIFCTAMFRKADFETNTNGYDTQMIEGLEDWEMWIQLLNKKSIVYKLKEELFFYRRTGNSRNKNTTNKKTLSKLMNYIYFKHFDSYTELLKTKKLNSISIIQKYSNNTTFFDKIKSIITPFK